MVLFGESLKLGVTQNLRGLENQKEQKSDWTFQTYPSHVRNTFVKIENVNNIFMETVFKRIQSDFENISSFSFRLPRYSTKDGHLQTWDYLKLVNILFVFSVDFFLQV